MAAGSAVTVLSGAPGHAELPDTAKFLAMLQRLAASADAAPLSPEEQACHKAFRWQDDFVVARAPGRMDVMGGIADYSGALVLQMPIAEACHVALQRQQPGSHQEAGLAPGQITVVSFLEPPPAQALTPEDEGYIHHPHRSPIFQAPLSDLFPDGKPLGYEAARVYFNRNKATSWAAYIVGCLLVLAREEGVAVDPSHDSIAMLVSSDVPEGKGVSSSAAVETATMMALAGAYGLEVAGQKLATMCQQAENLVVGAPCGIMDQMACALGEEGRLLALLCQPAEVEGCVEVPAALGARFWGIDSGVRHSVGGADYGSVRVGAFMGLRIARHLMEKQGGELKDVRSDCLVNIPPSLFTSSVEPQLPESLTGAEFKQQYGDHLDSVTNVLDDVRYAVRIPARHPVLDHQRVMTFRDLLLAFHDRPVVTSEERESQLLALGQLMFGTHDSYGACGLGCEGCDRLVDLVRQEMAQAKAEGRSPPVYGAKITGGGSGGTVCILAKSTPEGDEAIRRIVSAYTQQESYVAPPKVFQGSSMGAVQFGSLRVRLA